MHLVFRLNRIPNVLDKLPPNPAYRQLIDRLHIAVDTASFDSSTRPVPSVGNLDETLESKMVAVRAAGGRRSQLCNGRAGKTNSNSHVGLAVRLH